MFRTVTEARKHFKPTKLTKAQYKRLSEAVQMKGTKADWLILVSLISHQNFIWKARTTEVAMNLGISRSHAYRLLCEAEKAGLTSGWQTSADFTEQERHKTTSKFSREAIVWEILITDRRGRSNDKEDWGTADLDIVVAQMRKTLKARGIV
jgi:hypothetical protein